MRNIHNCATSWPPRRNLSIERACVWFCLTNLGCIVRTCLWTAHRTTLIAYLHSAFSVSNSSCCRRYSTSCKYSSYFVVNSVSFMCRNCKERKKQQTWISVMLYVCLWGSYTTDHPQLNVQQKKPSNIHILSIDDWVICIHMIRILFLGSVMWALSEFIALQSSFYDDCYAFITRHHWNFSWSIDQFWTSYWPRAHALNCYEKKYAALLDLQRLLLLRIWLIDPLFHFIGILLYPPPFFGGKGSFNFRVCVHM